MASKAKGILTQDEPEEFLDLRDQLKAEQKPGVSFPHNSCSSKELMPDLEANALTQYNLKCGLKEFGNEGLVALGKEMNQLYTCKVSKPVHGDDLTKEQSEKSVTTLSNVSDKQTMWQDEGTWMCQW